MSLNRFDLVKKLEPKKLIRRVLFAGLLVIGLSGCGLSGEDNAKIEGGGRVVTVDTSSTIETPTQADLNAASIQQGLNNANAAKELEGSTGTNGDGSDAMFIEDQVTSNE